LSTIIQFPRFDWVKFPFFVISDKDNLYIFNSRTSTRLPLNLKGRPLLFFRDDKTKAVALLFLNEKICKVEFDR
jgi:hypothetical protein